MTTGKRLGEFGKREPTPHSLAPKRSSHVTLLVMGTLAVGGGAYALMPIYAKDILHAGPGDLGLLRAAPAKPGVGRSRSTRLPSR